MTTLGRCANLCVQLLEILDFRHVLQHHCDEAYVVAADRLELSVEAVPADVVQEVVEAVAEAPDLVDHCQDDGQDPARHVGASAQREVDLENRGRW